MKIFGTALLVLAPLTLAVGCSSKIAVNEKNETDMGSHHVVVKPGSTSTSSSSSSGGENETFKYTCGDFSITIQNEELIVNNVLMWPIWIELKNVMVKVVDIYPEIIEAIYQEQQYPELVEHCYCT